MKTIGIYCFYSSKGIISKETIKQIIDFRNNLDYLILIINGKMENYEDIDCADRIIQRDNVGFDAGAYKDVLIMPEVKKMVQQSERLVLCNSTFFGPFNGFNEIFEDMGKKELDFWGINFFDNHFLRHIQSYFLVFNKRILMDEEFWKYWELKINATSKEIREVCFWFENGLFKMLSSKYKYGSYIKDLTYDIYKSPQKCLQMGLPIIKKKVFRKEMFNKEKILSCLKMILQSYDYSVDDILNEVQGEYGVEVSLAEIDNYNLLQDISSENYPVGSKSVEDLLNYVQSKQSVSIFGPP